MTTGFYRSEIAEKLLMLEGQPFSLENYPSYYAIYDSNYDKTLFKTSRQIGKSACINTRIYLTNGEFKYLKDIHVGDSVLSLDTQNNYSTKIITNKVTWVSDVYKKESVRIKTRTGNELDLALTHPVRTWNAWTKAKDLNVGTAIASTKKSGIFLNQPPPKKGYVELYGYLIGDGCIKYGIGFTSLPGNKLNEFIKICEDIGYGLRIRNAKGKAMQVNLSNAKELKESLQKDNLWGKGSATKFIPNWVFNLSEADTALFINRLWSTDGHIRKQTNSCYEVSYTSISNDLIRGLQSLLKKFGIPSSIRSRNPKYHRERGRVKLAYTLRIETKSGVNTFLSQIGALEKSEHIPLLTAKENNNRHTFPKEINEVITNAYNKIISKNSTQKRIHGKTLFSNGLHSKLPYKLTNTKLIKYIDVLNKLANPSFDSLPEINELQAHLDGDIFWDEIVSITPLGKIDCMDIEVENTHNFVSEGIVSHNSTTLANFMIAEAISMPFFKSLFIAPTEIQTRRFSHARLGKVLTYSTEIRKNFLSDSIDNVFMRVLNNGSEMYFSYCSDGADRIRGISSDRCLIDEVQDIDFLSIPIIEETMANSKKAYSFYCGTPKSSENGIERLWSLSSCTEWVIKCEGCGKYSQIVNTKPIGKLGIECLNCRKLLNPRNGMWVDMQDNKRIKGFHISQLHMVENLPICFNNQKDIDAAQKRWERILAKYESLGDSPIFMNEVLGISSSTGARLISKEELEAMCNSNLRLSPTPNPEHIKDVVSFFVGVDVGGSDVSDQEGFVKSRTVVSVLGATLNGKLKLVYHKIFGSGHSVGHLDEICRIFGSYGAKLGVIDHGGGALAASILKNKLGAHKLYSMRYVSSGKALEYKQDSHIFHGDKTTLLDSFVLFLKQNKLMLPNLSDCSEAIEDILAEYEEIGTSGTRKWCCSASKSDDSLHSLLYAYVAYKIYNKDLNFR